MKFEDYKIKTFSSSREATIYVHEQLKSWKNVDFKTFFRRAKEIGLTPVERAQYMNLLDLQYKMSRSRKDQFSEIIEKYKAKKSKTNYRGEMTHDMLNIPEKVVDDFDVEWLINYNKNISEFVPIKAWQAKQFKSNDLLDFALKEITEEGWMEKIELYKERYLKTLKTEFGESEFYNNLERKINSLSWEQFMVFSAGKSGKIGFRYEGYYERKGLERFGIAQENLSYVYDDLSSDLDFLINL